MLVTAVVRDPGVVIQVRGARLRELLGGDEDLARLILTAYLARRAILVELGAGVRVVGWTATENAVRVREFLTRNRVPHHWVDLHDDEVATLASALSAHAEELPLVICGQSVLHNPSNTELAAALGLGSSSPAPARCDLIIIGGGPAGLAAAVYGASEGLDTVLLDAVALGGQAGTSSRIENYFGFPTGISGADLTQRAALQAAKFGARLVVSADVADLARRPDGDFAITLRDGRVFTGRSVVVATGARYRRLDVPDLDRFVGAGVYYAATAVEARRCADGSVVIVGGGNSAGQAALYLAEHAARCRLIIRGPDLSRSMSQYLIDQLERHPEIELITHTQVIHLHGDDVLDAVTLHDGRSGRSDQVAVCGLFVFIGAAPCTGWLRDTLATDDQGFVLTGRDLPASALTNYRSDLPLVSETSQPGVFAVGDVRAGSVKRAASAVGEGSMAVRMIHQRLTHPATLTTPPDAPPATPTRVPAPVALSA